MHNYKNTWWKQNKQQIKYIFEEKEENTTQQVINDKNNIRQANQTKKPNQRQIIRMKFLTVNRKR